MLLQAGPWQDERGWAVLSLANLKAPRTQLAFEYPCFLWSIRA